MSFQEKYQNTFKQLQTSVTVEQIQRKHKEEVRKTIRSIRVVVLLLCIGFIVGNVVTYVSGRKSLIEMLSVYAGKNTNDISYSIVIGKNQSDVMILAGSDSTYLGETLDIRLEEKSNQYILMIEEMEIDITSLILKDTTGVIKLLKDEGYRTTYEKDGKNYEIYIHNSHEKVICEVKMAEF